MKMLARSLLSMMTRSPLGAPEPDRKYRKVCMNAIAQVTGASPKTIKDWGPEFGRCPKYIPRILSQADVINQFKQLVASGSITLPPDFPVE